MPGDAPKPGYNMGFGRLILSDVLPLRIYPSHPYSLYIDDSSVASFEEVTYRVIIPESIRRNESSTNQQQYGIRVTLSWYDPPAAVYTTRTLGRLSLLYTSFIYNSDHVFKIYDLGMQPAQTCIPYLYRSHILIYNIDTSYYIHLILRILLYILYYMHIVYLLYTIHYTQYTISTSYS